MVLIVSERPLYQNGASSVGGAKGMASGGGSCSLPMGGIASAVWLIMAVSSPGTGTTISSSGF